MITLFTQKFKNIVMFNCNTKAVYLNGVTFSLVPALYVSEWLALTAKDQATAGVGLTHPYVAGLEVDKSPHAV